MKKIFALVLALTLAFAFTACDSGSSDAAASLKIGVPNDTTNDIIYSIVVYTQHLQYNTGCIYSYYES